MRDLCNCIETARDHKGLYYTSLKSCRKHHPVARWLRAQLGTPEDTLEQRSYMLPMAALDAGSFFSAVGQVSSSH